MAILVHCNENHENAFVMSSSHADPVLGLNILQGWLGLFKYLNQCKCPGWGYLTSPYMVWLHLNLSLSLTKLQIDNTK